MEFEIPISIEQARQLALIVAKERAPRPMTAELMQDVLASYGFNVSYVALDEVVDGNVHAVLAISSQDGRTRLFSARPSDAIMLALLQPVQAPILVTPQLVGQRGETDAQPDESVGPMTADEDGPQDPPPPQADSPAVETEIATSAGGLSRGGED
jgi:bifunctional DNase/RNase